MSSVRAGAAHDREDLARHESNLYGCEPRPMRPGGYPGGRKERHRRRDGREPPRIRPARLRAFKPRAENLQPLTRREHGLDGCSCTVMKQDVDDILPVVDPNEIARVELGHGIDEAGVAREGRQCARPVTEVGAGDAVRPASVPGPEAPPVPREDLDRVFPGQGRPSAAARCSGVNRPPGRRAPRRTPSQPT